MISAVDMALEVGAIFKENAEGQKRLFLLCNIQLEQMAGLHREACAQFCEMAAASWANPDHRRVALILARGIRAMGEK